MREAALRVVSCLRDRSYAVGELAEAIDKSQSWTSEVVSVTDVYAALAYYHAHEEEMERHREAREQASADLRERIARDRPVGINPNE